MQESDFAPFLSTAEANTRHLSRERLHRYFTDHLDLWTQLARPVLPPGVDRAMLETYAVAAMIVAAMRLSGSEAGR